MTNLEKAKREFYFYKISGTAGGFMTSIFEAITRADASNRERLAMGFPDEVSVYMTWYYSENEDTFFANLEKEIKNETNTKKHGEQNG